MVVSACTCVHTDRIGQIITGEGDQTDIFSFQLIEDARIASEPVAADPASGNGNGAIAGGDPFRGAVVDALVSRVQGEAGADAAAAPEAAPDANGGGSTAADTGGTNVVRSYGGMLAFAFVGPSRGAAGAALAGFAPRVRPPCGEAARRGSRARLVRCGRRPPRRMLGSRV